MGRLVLLRAKLHKLPAVHAFLHRAVGVVGFISFMHMSVDVIGDSIMINTVGIARQTDVGGVAARVIKSDVVAQQHVKGRLHSRCQL